MRTLIVSSALLVLAGLAVADVSFIERTKEARTAVLKASDSKQPRMNAVYLQGKKVKFAETDEQTGKQVRISIFDGEKMTQKDANPLNQTYSELDAAYLAKRVESVKTRVADFETKLPSIPEDRRPRLARYIYLTKKVLGLLAEAPKVEMTKVGEKQKIGNWDCERFVIKEAKSSRTSSRIPT
ncbi:MAG: hypothetical protein K8T20_00230 [Planctomycetes bacterium]|nr:hypothetical protein [Planctomycetota bacterium]